MLVVVLERKRVPGGGVVVEIGDGKIGGEPACAGDEGVVDVLCCGGYAIESVVGDEPLARFAGE